MLKFIDIDLMEPARRGKRLRLPKLSPAELTEGREHGIVRPVVVRPITLHGSPRFEIVSNTRSWLLAQAVNIRKVPAYVREDITSETVSDEPTSSSVDAVTWAQAVADELLNGPEPISETTAARKLGVSLSVLSHRMRLLRLAGPVKRLLTEGALREGHVRMLVELPAAAQTRLAREIVAKKLSVRVAENLARRERGIPPRAGKGAAQAAHRPLAQPPAPSLKKDPNTQRLEELLSDHLGSKTTIENGKLVIDYGGNLDILDGVLEKVGVRL